MDTIKRTDRGRHYENHGTPPRPKPPETPEEDGRMLCPMSRKPCLMAQCMVWDEHFGTCAMGAVSMYNQVRDAMTDAMVDMQKSYGKEYRW